MRETFGVIINMFLFSAVYYSMLCSVIVCMVIYQLVFTRKVTQWKKSNIPFLKPTVFIGHKYFLNLFRNASLVAIDRIHRENENKDLVAFFITFIPVILLRDSQLIKKVFLNNSEKCFPSNFLPPNEDGIKHMPTFTSDRAKWRVARSIITPFYQDSKLRGPAFEKFNRHVHKMWEHIERVLTKNEPIGVKELARGFIADSVSLWSYGVDASYHEKTGDRRLMKICSDFFDPSFWRLFTIFATVQCPILQYFKEFRFIKGSHFKTMEDIVKEQVTMRDETQVNKDDFIDYLMDLRNKRSLEKDMTTHTAEPGISHSQMAAYCFSTFSAGMGNVEQMSVMITHMLSLHPKIQDRIKEEITAALEKHQVSELTFEVIQDLQFTKQCVMETVRLYPPLPVLFRRCTEDFQIPGTEYVLRKGDNVIINPYTLHRDSKYYKDANEFNPDRFSPENEKSITPDIFLSFGTGLRKCTTWMVGVSIVTIFTAAIVQKYEIKPRSHLRRMETIDFHPRVFVTSARENLLVDLVPRET